MKEKRYALIIAIAASFITPFTGSSINIALPSIGKELGMDAILLGWVNLSFLLFSAVFMVPLSRTADFIGRKKVFTIGVLISTVSTITAILSYTPWMLLLSRVLQGLGSAMIFSTGLAILTAVSDKSERGKIIGINVATVYIAMSLGPVIGGFLTQHLGWRSVFFVTLPFSAVAAFYAMFRLKYEWKEEVRVKFDIKGTIVYALSLFLIIYGLSLLPKMLGVWLAGSGLILIVIFIKLETITKHPLIDVIIFKTNRVFAFSNAAALLNYSATFAIGFLMSMYLQYVKKISPQYSGLILLSQPVIQAFFSPIAGKLSDKTEPRIVSTVGMCLTVTGLIMLSFVSSTTPVYYIIISLFIIGFSFALFSSPNTNAIMSAVDHTKFGLASSMVSTMRAMGQMLSMSIVMLLISLFIGRTHVGDENIAAFITVVRLSFSVFAGLCFLGIFASFARGKMHE